MQQKWKYFHVLHNPITLYFRYISYTHIECGIVEKNKFYPLIDDIKIHNNYTVFELPIRYSISSTGGGKGGSIEQLYHIMVYTIDNNVYDT